MLWELLTRQRPYEGTTRRGCVARCAGCACSVNHEFALSCVSSGDKDVYDLMQKVCWEGKRPELPDLPKVACRVAETVLVDLWVCGHGLDR